MSNFSFPPFPEATAIRNPHPQHVIVLGAGLAGLSAGYTLLQYGHRVTILEASDRVGGRVLTLRSGFTPGLHADAGAAFIPGTHTYVVGFVQAFGLKLVPIVPVGITRDFINGQIIDCADTAPCTWPVQLNEFERRTTPLDWLRKYLTPPLGAVLATAPRAPGWPPPSLKAIDAMSYEELLKANGASDGAIAILRMGFSDLWGDGIQAASALLLLRDDAFSIGDKPSASPTAPAPMHPARRQFRAHHAAMSATSGSAPAASAPRTASAVDPKDVYRLVGGSDTLPQAFAERMPGIIRTGTPVVRITQSSTEVAVYLQNESVPIVGDRIVCTLPFSTLRDITVDPPFSPQKATAVQELPYTSVVRVFLEYNTRFWNAQHLSGVASTDLPDSEGATIPGFWIEDATLGQESPQGILDCYITGEWSRRLTVMDEAERVACAQAQVEKVFPGAAAHYSGHAMSQCWDGEPWQKGDYCWFRPGQMSTLAPSIPLPEGRIHFAGDHASALPGWMQGALESGLRAANEINLS